jgi:hypothetical protein
VNRVVSDHVQSSCASGQCFRSGLCCEVRKEHVQERVFVSNAFSFHAPSSPAPLHAAEEMRTFARIAFDTMIRSDSDTFLSTVHSLFGVAANTT